MLRFMMKCLLWAPVAVALSLPAQAQERQWSFDATDRQAFLVFGVPDTDDVGLSFWCDIGTNRMAAYLPDSFARLKPGERTTMTITVDGKVFALPATAARDPASGHITVEGKFKAKDPLMASLSNGETVGVSIKGHSATYPLADADFEGLLNTCAQVDTGN
jgi:hypothetical protein